jgi:hypothetical protein
MQYKLLNSVLVLATFTRSQREAYFTRFDDYASSKDSKIRTNNNGKLIFN